MKNKVGKTDQANELDLFLSSNYNELTKKYVTTFRLETSQIFTTFRYEIDVEETFHDNQITFKLIGLKTPRLLIPGGGPATFEKKYASLKGNYIVEIIGIDKRKNVFEISISKYKIKVIKTPEEKFINICIQNFLK
ncbi:MAG: hypothetical protein Q8K98_04085 [Bacteroidota bacterium]|nr:hypothetical protein [Bacteroidota bacterium]